MTCQHSAPALRALAYRFILAAVDDDNTQASHARVGRLLGELHNCCDDCIDLVLWALADFGAERIQRSAAPDRWDRWISDRIALWLDEAQQADA